MAREVLLDREIMPPDGTLPPPDHTVIALHALVLRRLAEGKIELPILPRAVQDLFGALDQESTDARALSEIIQRDQALAGHVLRWANSPLFACATPIVSLTQACARLGLSRLREIALLISMKSQVFSILGFKEEILMQFRHALVTGLYAREIARMVRTNVEEAFLLGLLHDVGKPIALHTVIGLGGRDLPRDEVFALVDALHCEVGAAVASRWAFPPAIVAAIGNHHTLVSDVPAFAVLRLADALSQVSDDDHPPLSQRAIERHEATQLLNLYPEDVAALLGKAEAISRIARSSA